MQRFSPARACSSRPAVGEASSTKFNQGGTLHVVLPVTDVDDVDPSLAHGRVSWHIEPDSNAIEIAGAQPFVMEEPYNLLALK